jgi:aldehyde:ferredoxin oxidoreductase
MTGINITLEDMYTVADRIYALIRAFWVREFGNKWNRNMDIAPARWFTEPLTKGAFKGTKLDQTGYENMLQLYYKKRGWDQRGIPTKSTLATLGLQDVAQQLSQHVQLNP